MDRVRVGVRALLVAALVAVGVWSGASPAGAALSAFAGHVVSGSVVVHAGDDQVGVDDLSGRLELAWVSEAAHTVSGSVTLDPIVMPTFTGPFDLQLYATATIVEAAATTGMLNESSGVVGLATSARMTVAVYHQLGAGPDPASDPRLTGPGCGVDVAFGWTGTTDGVAVAVSDSQFTIPAFPSGDSGCGAATDELNHRVAGDDNSVQLTFDGDSTEPVTNGFLRVTTSPAVPAGIVVDGIVRDSWALTWPELPVGAHRVCFTRVPGYSTPPCQNVTVTAGVTSAVVGAYSAKGYLRVLTSPAVASTVSVDGVDRNDWGLWTEFAPGVHNVCFGAVQGFDVPACREVTVEAGATATTTGTFVSNPAAVGPVEPYGLLRATTAAATDAMISVDGLERNTWGLDWLKVPVGTYTVCFGGAPNLSSPPTCSAVDVTEGNATVIQGTYLPRGFLRVVTAPGVAATITVNGQVANAYGVWTDKAPGTYTVCFGDVPGYVTPPCQNGVAVTANNTTPVTGTYTPGG